MAEEPQAGGGNSAAVVVVKKRRHEKHGHHGGAWKVAYADFVTAMMAFFLLLWLLATTTEEQRIGIAHYFNPPNNSTEYGGGNGIMSGSSVVKSKEHAPEDSPVVPLSPIDSSNDMAMQAKEDAMFRQVADELKKAVMNIPQLKALLDNMLVDVTPEGLRITLTDSTGRPLFENGDAKMYDYTHMMLAVVASVLGPLPNHLAVGGHTDVVPYRGANPGYTNWELSSDRAQAARRVMMDEGIPEGRMERVAGYASQQPLLVDHPDSVRNRRITITVLRSNRGATAQFSQDGLLAPREGRVLELEP